MTSEPSRDPSPHFAVDSFVMEGVAVVRVKGEIDLATAPTLRGTLLESANQQAGQVVLDLTHVTFCDSTGLGVFLQAHHAAQVHQRVLHLVGATGPVARVLALTEMDRLFVSHDTTAEAISVARALSASIRDARPAPEHGAMDVG